MLDMDTKNLTLAEVNSIRARVGLAPITQAQLDKMIANNKARFAKRVYRGWIMIVFRIVSPEQLAEFAAYILRNACREAKRAAFERILALALYHVAREHEIMEINGRLAVDFTDWLLNGDS